MGFIGVSVSFNTLASGPHRAPRVQCCCAVSLFEFALARPPTPAPISMLGCSRVDAIGLIWFPPCNIEIGGCGGGGGGGVLGSAFAFVASLVCPLDGNPKFLFGLGVDVFLCFFVASVGLTVARSTISNLCAHRMCYELAQKHRWHARMYM